MMRDDHLSRWDLVEERLRGCSQAQLTDLIQRLFVVNQEIADVIQGFAPKERPAFDWNNILDNPPPWIWDSAAPLPIFYQAHRDNNRMYWGARLSLKLASRELIHLAPRDETWKGIKDETESYNGRRGFDPQHLERDKKTLRRLLAQAAIVKEASDFELFLGCWVWNMLLEMVGKKNQRPTTKHERLFSRIVDQHKMPTRDEVLRAFPQAKEALNQAARRKSAPWLKDDQGTESSPSAWDVTEMWQEVRNRLVHKNGIVDKEFINSQYHKTWIAVCADKKGTAPLLLDSPFPLEQRHVEICFTNYDVAASALKKLLVTYSEERRGHIDAPGKDQKRTDIPCGTKVPNLFFQKEFCSSYEFNERGDCVKVRRTRDTHEPPNKVLQTDR